VIDRHCNITGSDNALSSELSSTPVIPSLYNTSKVNKLLSQAWTVLPSIHLQAQPQAVDLAEAAPAKYS